MVGVEVEEASSWDLLVEFVVEAVVVEGVEGMCSLGFGSFGSERGADVLGLVWGAVLGAVPGAVDIDEVIVVTKVAVDGVDRAES